MGLFLKVRQKYSRKNPIEEIKHNFNFINTKDCKLAPWIIQETKSFIIAEIISKAVNQKTYYNIYPQGSQPGKLYGVVKPHNKNYQMRPV